MRTWVVSSGIATSPSPSSAVTLGCDACSSKPRSKAARSRSRCNATSAASSASASRLYSTISVLSCESSTSPELASPSTPSAFVATKALGVLGDASSGDVLLSQLRTDIVEYSRLADAELAALVALHRERDLAALLRGLLEHASHPNVTALEGLGLVAIPELTTQVRIWATSRDARIRAAACAALATQPANDTHVRKLLRSLVRDRDALVRAAAVSRLPDEALVKDTAPEVR